MSIQSLEFHGLPAFRLALPEGDAVVVARHGAQVLSWIGAGVERMYLSPQALMDGHSAIRGGVPICFPQFNQRGPLPKHGFVRNMPWQLEDHGGAPRELALVLHEGDATRAFWPHAFRAELRVALQPGSLRMTLTVDNTGSAPWTFAAALHTYLRVDEIADVRLEGLLGANRWDAVRDDRHVEMAPALRFTSEFDSVYASPAGGLRLVQPSGTLAIRQSASCTETVVWNPGAQLSAKLADMPDDGYRHMLCVEAARIDEPVQLHGGAQWKGWQELTLA
ncbi:MAG: D-hexose-6-phosphate mutarotase [Proteobacteria bacterium]|nr:D-hexose-6-phosphate mutarotase [Pseudomonadota bacterium]